MTCPRCGFDNLEGQPFCGQCNLDLSAGDALPQAGTGRHPSASLPGKADVLTHYPVICVEVMNLNGLERILGRPEAAQRLAQDLMVRLESQLVAQNAVIESVRDTVLFFSFRTGGTLGQLLGKAMKIGMALATQEIPVQSVKLKLRVGVDLAKADGRDPMTAVPERMAAEPGEMVVSQMVYDLTKKLMTYEPYGPLAVQGQRRMFYRWRQDLAAKSQDDPMPGNQSAVQTMPDSGRPDVSRQAEKTAPAETVAKYAHPVSQPEPRPEEEASSARSPVRQTVGPASAEPVYQEPDANAPLRRQFEPMEPAEPLQYDIPKLLIRLKQPRKPDFAYGQALLAMQAQLQEMLESSRKPGAALFALAAPEAAGKSTLLSLLRGQFPEDAFFWLGGNSLRTETPDRYPMFFWSTALQNLLGFPLEPLPVNEGSAHLQQLLQSMFEDALTPDELDFYRALLSLKPVAPINSQLRHKLGRAAPYIAKLLNRLGQSAPLILIWEDIQHADTASLEVLAQLLEGDLITVPMGLIMTLAPDTAFYGNLQQAISMRPLKEYSLEAMDWESLIQIAEPPLETPWKKLPEALQSQILSKASPMYLEETFRWLHGHGGFVLHPKTGKFSIEKKKIKDLLPRIPDSLEQLIAERFALLEDKSRYVLQLASVLGERFSINMLTELAQLGDLSERLNMLWQEGFLAPENHGVARFRHGKIWDIVHRSIPPDLLPRLHQLTADYLQVARERDCLVAPVQVAHHLEQAGALEPALVLWQESAAWMADVGSLTGSNLMFRELQQVLQGHQVALAPAQQRWLYETLGLLNLDQSPDYARLCFLNALETDTDIPVEESVQTLLMLARAYEKTGRFGQAVSRLHQAYEAIPAAGNDMERLMIVAQELWLLHQQGKTAEVLFLMREAWQPVSGEIHKAAWRDPMIRETYAKGQLALAYAGLMSFDPAAFRWLEDGITQAELHQVPDWAVSFRLAQCLGFLLKGNIETCKRELERSLNDIEQLGVQPQWMAWWGLITLMFHCEMGDWASAAMIIPNTGYQAEQAHDYLTWCLCKVLAGAVSVANRNYGEANRLLEEGVTAAAQFHLSLPALVGWRYLAENELAADNHEVALQLCQRALEVSNKPAIINRLESARLTLLHARILIARDDFKTAGLMLERAWPSLVKSGYMPLVAEAAFAIATLYRKLAQGVPQPHQDKYRKQSDEFLQKARMLWKEQGNQYRLGQLAVFSGTLGAVSV